MIPTSEPLATWLRHIAGEQKLVQRQRPLEGAVELNRAGPRIISTYGRKRFSAAIGFIDMRGFTARTRGKPPEKVRAVASPFVRTVIDVAVEHDCFIDKTIGDEIMIVMPSFGRDALLADIGVRQRDPVPLSVGEFLTDVVRRLGRWDEPVRFAAGFAFGKVVLDRVGTSAYGEWTVYGNAVNAAKRLQSHVAKTFPAASCAAIGALSADEPDFRAILNAWVKTSVSDRVGTLRLDASRIEEIDLVGAGRAVCVLVRLDAVAKRLGQKKRKQVK